MGQFSATCAGVSVAVIKFHQLNLLHFDENTKNDITKRLRDEGKIFYDLGCRNEPHEVEQNGFIELRSIYHMRNERNLNIVYCDSENRISFSSSFTAMISPQNITFYMEGYNRSKFSEVFNTHGFGERNNFIVCTRRHYITVVVIGENYKLIDGLGKFRIFSYGTLDALLQDLDEYVGTSNQFTIHSADYVHGIFLN